MTDTLVQILWSGFIVGGFLLLLIVPAVIVEWWQSRGMRRRQRRRARYQRYVEAIDRQAARLESGCWHGPERQP